MPSATLQLLDSLTALADSTRYRMLWLLEGQELSVSELSAVLQLPQSTVSRHLKTLSDAGWVMSRRDGTSRYYALASGPNAQGHADLWEVARRQLEGRPDLEQDRRRLSEVLTRRSEASQQFFATAAGQWDRLRDDLFGRGFFFQALLGLLPSSWAVGDLGCGTGALLAGLAPYVGRVVGVDASADMLSAARDRVRGFDNVELRQGTLEALPIERETLDAAIMMLVLHHLPSPGPVLVEAARVLRPGGRLLIVDMAPHEREEYRQQMGHVWLGFSEPHVQRLIEQAGFASVRVDPLPPAAEAKGPALFAAVATK